MRKEHYFNLHFTKKRKWYENVQCWDHTLTPFIKEDSCIQECQQYQWSCHHRNSVFLSWHGFQFSILKFQSIITFPSVARRVAWANFGLLGGVKESTQMNSRVLASILPGSGSAGESPKPLLMHGKEMTPRFLRPTEITQVIHSELAYS